MHNLNKSRLIPIFILSCSILLSIPSFGQNKKSTSYAKSGQNKTSEEKLLPTKKVLKGDIVPKVRKYDFKNKKSTNSSSNISIDSNRKFAKVQFKNKKTIPKLKARIKGIHVKIDFIRSKPISNEKKSEINKMEKLLIQYEKELLDLQK